MPVVAPLLWTLGVFSLFGLFFWVSILLPARATPRMQEGWRWLQWRPLPVDLPQWMGMGFCLALLLQTITYTFLFSDEAVSLPPGVLILLSILMFQGLLTGVFFLRMRKARIDVPQALGLDSPFMLREMIAGLVGYCMSLPLVAIAGLLTHALYVHFDWEIVPQPLLEEFASVSGWMNWVTLFLLVGFIGPLLEEVVFRGFLFTWLRQRLGIHGGLWVQAVVFALIHQHGAGFLPLLALSLVLGLAYVYTQRFMVCVWIHAYFNMMTLVNLVLMPETVTG